MRLDPRIGTLNNGKFYAFAHGYDKPATVGSLGEVETALGLRAAAPARAAKLFTVTLRFQFPAWDERDGIEYPGINAKTKAEANATARRLAYADGHTGGGKGRYTFTAVEED